MYRYTIEIEINGLEDTFESEDEYEIGDRIFRYEKGGEVIYHKNGEVAQTIFPKPVYGTIVAKERITG